MPQPSHDNSSTKSKPAAKGSAQAAAKSARNAFAAPSTLNLETTGNKLPPEQEGRKRLANSYFIQRSRVIPDPDQPRQKFDEMAMLELVASIRERGVKQPLTVRWNPVAAKYMVIDGGRRYEAATRLKLDELPCWVQEGDNKDILIDQIVHNWQRVDLRPYETADALARLRDKHGLKQIDLVKVTGKPKSEISKLLALHDKVDPDVQQMARNSADNKLTRRHLYNISKLKPDQQKQVARKVQNDQLTAKETEQLVKDKSPNVNIKKGTGVAARQRRFKTKNADVVFTFRKRTFTEQDVRNVVAELNEIIGVKARVNL
ncbi:ParB/RepB/Spo0J family partition protein [bacterium]|nr:ParB/RepB/Spo0J family partition protein [bacterium]